MRVKYRPRVERLESYELMTGMMVAPVSVAPAAVTASPITLTLTTDQSSYSVGQPVHMTLTETNTSSQTVQITDGPSIDGFSVSQNGTTIWRSNAGMQPMFLREVTLNPGQSLTLTATWDGHPNNTPTGTESSATPTGTFQVSSQVSQDGATAAPVTITIGAASTPTPTATPTPKITSTPTPTPTVTPPAPATASALAVSVSVDRPMIVAGQPLMITLTETNKGTRAVSLPASSSAAYASITGPRGPIWLSYASATPTVLQPGQSRRFVTIRWNGGPDLPGRKADRGLIRDPGRHRRSLGNGQCNGSRVSGM